MGWSKDRCCVAVPLYNVGIYAILAQYAVISLVTGVLSFAAPYIVAVSIVTGGSYILGAVCLIVFGLQGWGFFGVYKEKPATYRKYVHVNAGVVALAFIVALIWIILSAARHSTAVGACVEQFVNNEDADISGDDSSLINLSSGTVSGQQLCNIFTWVQLGIMSGLWLALFLVEIYFTIMSRVYGTEQRSDHKRYNSIYTDARQSYIRQSQVWGDHRPSMDELEDPNTPTGLPPRFGHSRGGSSVSKSSALRNELRLPLTDEDGDPNDYSRGSEGYADVPLDGTGHSRSPTKEDASAYARPVSGYSTTFAANSRSRLAPENSTPAYQQQHSRNTSANLLHTTKSGNAGGRDAYGNRESQYDDADGQDDGFASYYMR